MATGTVTLHSWNDSQSGSAASAEDEGWPPVGTNYNCRLKIREDYNNEAAGSRRRVRERGGLGGLRSTVVRPARLGLDDEDDAEERTSRW